MGAKVKKIELYTFGGMKISTVCLQMLMLNVKHYAKTRVIFYSFFLRIATIPYNNY